MVLLSVSLVVELTVEFISFAVVELAVAVEFWVEFAWSVVKLAWFDVELLVELTVFELYP